MGLPVLGSIWGLLHCLGFGKAQTMENFDHQVDTHGGADDGDENRLTSGRGRGEVAGGSAVDFAVGNEFF